MTLQPLEEVCFAEPFKAFSLHLADGRELRIPHPEFLVFTSSEWIVIVYGHDDSRDVVDLELVTSLRIASPKRT